jgi:hypothetical protein
LTVLYTESDLLRFKNYSSGNNSYSQLTLVAQRSAFSYDFSAVL